MSIILNEKSLVAYSVVNNSVGNSNYNIVGSMDDLMN